MPLLADARHEQFVHHLLAGKGQGDAYVAAGFSKNAGNAGRLYRNPDVQARLTELKEAAAKKAVVSAADIVEQLAEDRKFAREEKAPAAAVSATMGQAKVLGLLSDRVEHTGKDGGPIEMADTDLARLIVFQLTKAAQQAE